MIDWSVSNGWIVNKTTKNLSWLIILLKQMFVCFCFLFMVKLKKKKELT